MSSKFTTEYPLGLIIAWGIVGYPLLAGISEIFGLQNSQISFIVRLGITIASLFLLFKKNSSISREYIALFFSFWIIYIIRIFYTLEVASEKVSQPNETYWSWALGASLIPCLAIYMNFSRNREMERLRELLQIISLVSIILILKSGSTNVISDSGIEYDQNRWNLSSLSPISVGHLGATAVLLGVSCLLSGEGRYIWKFVSIFNFLLGMTALLLSNSRGPVISFAVAIFFLFLASPRAIRIIILTACFSLLVCAFFWFGGSVMALDGGLLDRFMAISDGSDISAYTRTVSFNGAINQFLNSPFTGDGIEERLTNFYPHNVVLEAFMATGVLGGLLFTAILWKVIFRSYYLIKNIEYSWIGLIAVEQVAGAMMSGSLMQSYTMWCLVGLVLATG